MTNKELREKVKEIVLHDSDVDKVMALFEQVKSSGWGDVRIDQTKEQGGEFREKINKMLDSIKMDSRNLWATGSGSHENKLRLARINRTLDKLDELTSLVDKPKVDTGEKVFTKEWVDSHEGGYVAISAIEKYAKQLLKNRGYVKAEVTQPPNLEERLTGLKSQAEAYELGRSDERLLATKEHDGELLKEFQSWFNDREEWAFDDTCVIDDVTLALFIASRKVSSSGEGK